MKIKAEKCSCNEAFHIYLLFYIKTKCRVTLTFRIKIKSVHGYTVYASLIKQQYHLLYSNKLFVY